MKRKEPRVLTIHIVPSKKLTPDMEKAEIYNRMMAEKIWKESQALIDYWRKRVERQNLIKEMLSNEKVVSRKNAKRKQSGHKKKKL